MSRQPEEAQQLHHGDLRRCSQCGGVIEYVEYTAWNGLEFDVLDAWWSHLTHPADGHDALPTLVDSQCWPSAMYPCWHYAFSRWLLHASTGHRVRAALWGWVTDRITGVGDLFSR